MPFKTFTAGTLATASDVNTYLMNQSIATFSSASARNAAITSPVEGQMAYISGNDILSYYTGSAWANFLFAEWVAYTPTFANFSLGNGTVTAKYIQQGKMVTVSLQVTLGSTSSVSASGGIQFSLPVAYASTARFHGQCRMVIGSTFVGTLIAGSLNAIMYANNVSATWESVNLTSNTVPGTWTTGSSFIAQATYEVV
jgi:hypothetical protein